MVTLFPVATVTVLIMMHFADNVVMDGLSLDKREWPRDDGLSYLSTNGMGGEDELLSLYK